MVSDPTGWGLSPTDCLPLQMPVASSRSPGHPLGFCLTWLQTGGPHDPLPLELNYFARAPPRTQGNIYQFIRKGYNEGYPHRHHHTSTKWDFLEASSHRQDQLLTPFSAPLPSQWHGGGAENSKSDQTWSFWRPAPPQEPHQSRRGGRGPSPGGNSRGARGSVPAPGAETSADAVP